MPGTAFTRPARPDGQSEAALATWSALYQFAGAANGDTDWQRLWNLTGTEDDDDFILTVQNQGAGGHILVPNLFSVTDSGVLAGALNVVGDATVGGLLTAATLIVSGTSTHNGDIVLGNASADTLTVNATETHNAAASFNGNVTLGNAGSDNISILGFATFTPSAIFSAGLTSNGPTNFNAGVTLGDAASDVILVVGTTTFSSPLTIAPASATDAGLVIKGISSGGQFTLGGSNSATPDAILKNNAGTQTARMLNSGLLIVGTPTAALGTAGAGDVQCNDVWLTATGSTTNFRRLIAAGDAFQLSGNGDVGTDMTIDSAGLVTIKALSVDNGVTITNGPLLVPTTSPPTANNAVTSGSLIKAFARIVGATGVISQSQNIASVTRNGAGDYSIVIDRDFAAATYGVLIGIENGSRLMYRVNSKIAGSADVHIEDTAGTKTDPTAFTVAMLGTLT